MAIIYLADLNISNNLGVPVTLNYSSGKTVTVSGTVYTAKISQPAFLGQSISIDSSIGGAISSSIGELILTNSKRDLDYLKTYIFEGKDLIIYSYDTVSLVKTKILTQVIEQATFEWAQISVRIENKSASLDVPLQTKKYLGDNILPDGVEGVIDLKDKLKPLVFGRVNNITPILVNTSKLIYQISSEPVEQVVSVMTRGAYVSLADAVITSFADFINETNAALYPPAGYYTFYSGTEGSFFRLGMASEVVTCTVWEKISALNNSPAQVIKRVLNYAGITSYVSSDITYIDSKIADNIGLFLNGSETVSAILTDICSSIGAWWGFDQSNNFRLYYFGDVTASNLATIHVKTDPDKYGITSFEMANATINGKTDPVKEVTLDYAKNYTVEDKGSIAGIITTTDIERATWLSEEFRKAKAVKDITSLYSKSQILTYPTLFNSEYSAISEAERVLAFTSVKRNIITITARMPLSELIALYPCGIVNIVLPRYGFDNGKKCIIIGMEIDFLNYTANLTLWGDIFDLQYMPSLNLNFLTMGEVLPSNVTYARTGQATRVNKLGYMEVVTANTPRFYYDTLNYYSKGVLIEESRTNLATYSCDLSNSVWNKARGSAIYNCLTAPDGTLTADKLIEDTQTGPHYISKSAFIYVASTTYTLSCFVKKGERSKGSISMGNGTVLFTNGLSFAGSNFDLTAKTNIKTATADNAGILEYRDGWFKIWMTATVDATGGTDAYFPVFLNNGTTTNYAGTYNSGMYIWGIQLEVGNSPTSFIPQTETFTSRSTIASYITSTGTIAYAPINTPRYIYNPETALSTLLLETNSSNLNYYSSEFKNWGGIAAGVIPDAITAPDGTLTADYIYSLPSTNLHYLDFVISVTSSSSIYATSIYVKQGLSTTVQISNYILGGTTPLGSAISSTFSFVTGTITNSNTTGSVVYIGNGWYRISNNITNNNTGNTSLFTRVCTGGSLTSYLGGNTSVYVWGAQVETGFGASSYIYNAPTFVSRAGTIGTYYNSLGKLVNNSTGAVRLSYNPNNLTIPPAQLTELAGTNYACNSLFTSSLTKSVGTHTAPDGNLCSSVSPISGTTLSFATIGSATAQTFTLAAAATTDRCFTGYFAPKVNNPQGIVIYPVFEFWTATGSANHIYTTFIVNIETLTITPAIPTDILLLHKNLELAPCGMYKLTLVIRYTQGATVRDTSNFYIQIRDNTGSGTFVGDGVSGYDYSHLQYEHSAYPSSYIPTTTVAVTRSADITTLAAKSRVDVFTSVNDTRGQDTYKIDGTNFTDFYNTSEGTLTTTCTFNSRDNISVVPTMFSSTNSLVNSYFGFKAGSDGILNYAVNDNTGTIAASNTLTSTFPYGQTVSMACSYKLNSFNSSYEGGTVVTDTLGTVPTVGILTIGSSWDTSTQTFATDSLNGFVSRITYYPSQIISDLPNISKVN